MMRMPKTQKSTSAESKHGSGFALIELLVMLLILGGLGALAAYGAGTFSGSGTPSTSGGTPTISDDQSLAQEPNVSAIAACNTDAKVVEIAVMAFEATNSGSVPTVGELLSKANGGPYLQAYPHSEYFSISVDASGNIEVSLNSTAQAATAPHRYPTDKPPFRGFAVNYDAWTWSKAATAGTAYPSTANVCEGV
jgi:hypothetical protein